MPKCGVKRGFFVLRDCRTPATGACSYCQRSVCGEHVVARGNAHACFDCHARQMQLTEERQRESLQTGEPGYDRTGPYVFRHGFYTREEYHPIYFGGGLAAYYSAYDVRSFNKKGQGDLGDGSSSGGFFDS